VEMEAESELCEVDVSSDGRDGGVWLGGTGCGGEVRSMWTGGEGDVKSTLALAKPVVGSAELASGLYPKLYPRMSASRLEVERSCSPGAAGCCADREQLAAALTMAHYHRRAVGRRPEPAMAMRPRGAGEAPSIQTGKHPDSREVARVVATRMLVGWAAREAAAELQAERSRRRAAFGRSSPVA
jgi:hypothetical protein